MMKTDRSTAAGVADFDPFGGTFRDSDGRRLRLSVRRPPAGAREALAALYDRFGTRGRAQGIPPASDKRRDEWLTRLLENGTIDVIAREGSRVVGHAILVAPASGGAHELAVFVGPDSRGVGIGNELLSAVLDAGRVAGLERVELLVEHSNRPARRLYQRHGFEPTARDSYVLEMARTL